MLSLIVSSEKEVQHQYLIHPMSGEVRVVIDTRSQIDMNTPKVRTIHTHTHTHSHSDTNIHTYSCALPTPPIMSGKVR